MWARQTVSGLGTGAGVAAALGSAARGTAAGKSTGSGGGATIRMWSAAMIRPGGRRGARLGGKAAHLALDHPRVVPATAPLGRHRRDLDQDQLKHAAPPVRGKTQHGTADAAGRCAPCG